MILSRTRLLSLMGTLLFVLVHTVGDAGASESCPGDYNNDGRVSVDELVRSVDAALRGCPTPGPSSGSTLLRSGQTECDQGQGTLGECPGSPLGQDAAVVAGVPLSYTDNGDGTISDNVTGLMWEKLSSDHSAHDVDRTYKWSEAFDKISALNADPCFAEHCDWRLPNRRELESIVDAGRFAPSADPVFYTLCESNCRVTACSCTQFDGTFYWTSTTQQDSPSFAWSIDFNEGNVFTYEKNLVPLYVRAVRGGL